MSHFKKNLDEHYNYFSMLYEVRLAEYLANKDSVRFVAASDLFTLNYYKQVLANTNDEDFNHRFAQISDDLLARLQSVQDYLRKKYKTDNFMQLKSQKKSDKDFQEQLIEDRANFATLLNQSGILSALQTALSKSLAMNIGKVNTALQSSQDRQDAAYELAMDFMGMGNTSISTLMDYLIDFDFVRNGKSQSLTDMIRQLNFAAMNYYRSQLGQKTVSTEEALQGGKADSRDVTREETLVAPEEKSMQEVTEESYQNELKSITQFIRILSALGYNELKETLKSDFITKKSLFDNRDSLTPEQIDEYNSVTQNIKANLDVAVNVVNASNQSPQVKSDFNALASQVANALFIPGSGAESFEEVLEEPDSAVQAPKAGSASLATFQSKARANYDKLRDSMIESTRFLHKKPNPYFPYLSGVKTDEQREAAKSGNVDTMMQSGMSIVDAFKVKLMDIVHDWDIRHKWESSGNKLSDTDRSKNANDEYLKDLRTLASQPPFSDENGNVRPEILQLIATVVPPRRGSADLPQASSTWQYMQQGFDIARINAELTRMLSNLGIKSFAELRGMENSPELDAELNKIISEESHFGTHVGLPGEATQHSAYLPFAQPQPMELSDDMKTLCDKLGCAQTSEALMKKCQDVVDGKELPQGVTKQECIGALEKLSKETKFKQARMLYFTFDPQSFKNYLKDIVIKYINDAERLEKSPKSPPPAGGIPDPGQYGIKRQVRKNPKQDQAAESTKLGPESEADTASYAFGLDELDATEIPTEFFAYEEDEEIKPKIRRFKIIVK